MSIAGLIREIGQNAKQDDVLVCTVTKTKPIQLKYEGDSKVLIDKDVLVIPKHVKKLKKGSLVLVHPTGDGERFFVIGKG